ncbi:SDR family oxidoreductase [Rhizobium brockwellii]|uniref:SDR family oxidoreductase n=1 Tax=Rhizobium brockwellii TaxID=3019932 RepID=A0ABU3YVV1_9HYPH|nr:SDR family oxidoreductase [Rhizobium brockwellii]MDV4183146.1 SDR family oxidoreductase [Rhizobium brockwellii]MDV4189971.1 SDR family oxidoreductase [Rhizobium brockwellii]
MGKLDNKVALVTGGSSGMGLDTARLFIKEGAKVVITGRNRLNVEAAASEIGADFVQGDVSKLQDIIRLRDHLKDNYGRIDVIFANAGGGTLVPFEDVTEDDFNTTVDTNFKGTFFTVQKLLPLVPDGGSIILNTSIAGSKGLPNFSVYSATKAALRSLARTWTTDLKVRGIRVNALAPGHIATDILRKSGLSAEQVNGINGLVIPLIPLGRMGTGEEIAGPALFLASDDSAYVTGIELTVDGGWAQV